MSWFDWLVPTFIVSNNTALLILRRRSSRFDYIVGNMFTEYSKVAETSLEKRLSKQSGKETNDRNKSISESPESSSSYEEATASCGDVSPDSSDSSHCSELSCNDNSIAKTQGTNAWRNGETNESACNDSARHPKTQQTQVTQGATTQATSNEKKNDNENTRLDSGDLPCISNENGTSCHNENEMKTTTAQASLDKTLSLVNKHIQNAKISLSDMNDVSHLKHYLLSFLDISDIIQSIFLINKHWYHCVTLKNNDESNLVFWKNHLFDTFKNLSILRNVNAKNSVFYAKYGKSEWYKEFEYYDKNVAIMACQENNDKKEFDKLVFNMGRECFVLTRQFSYSKGAHHFDSPTYHNSYYEQCTQHEFYRWSMAGLGFSVFCFGECLEIWQQAQSMLDQQFNEIGLLDKDYNITTILKIIDYVSSLVSKLEEMNDKGDEREKDEKRFLFGQLFSVFNWFNVITLNYHDSLVTKERNDKTNITSFASGTMLKYLLLTFGNRLDKCDGLNGKNYISNMGNNKDIEDGLSWHGFIFRLIFQCDIIMQGRTFPYDVTDYNDEKIDRSQCFKNESKDFSFELLHSRAMIRKILFNNDYTWENTLGIWRNCLLLEMYAFNNVRFLNNIELFDVYIGDKCLKLKNRRLSPFITGIASFIQGRMHHKTMIVIDYLLFLKQFKQYPDLINDKTFEYSSLIFNSVTEWDSTHLYRMLKSDELSIDALTTLKGLKNIGKLGVSKIYPFLTIKKYIRTNNGRTSTMKFDC